MLLQKQNQPIRFVQFDVDSTPASIELLVVFVELPPFGRQIFLLLSHPRQVVLDDLY